MQWHVKMHLKHSGSCNHVRLRVIRSQDLETTYHEDGRSAEWKWISYSFTSFIASEMCVMCAVLCVVILRCNDSSLKFTQIILLKLPNVPFQSMYLWRSAGDTEGATASKASSKWLRLIGGTSVAWTLRRSPVRKEEGGRRKRERGRRKEEGGRRKEEKGGYYTWWKNIIEWKDNWQAGRQASKQASWCRKCSNERMTRQTSQKIFGTVKEKSREF